MEFNEQNRKIVLRDQRLPDMWSVRTFSLTWKTGAFIAHQISNKYHLFIESFIYIQSLDE